MTFPGDHLMLNRLCQYSSIFFLLTSLTGTASAQKAKPQEQSRGPPPQNKYEKIKLKNALDVNPSADQRLPLVPGTLWYHVLPATERPRPTGFTHLFEHMMIQ